MALALTFAAFALISLGSFWMGLSGLRNLSARIRNASTGASTPAGCSAPAFLSMGLGAALVSYLMGRDVQGPYFVVLFSLAGPLLALWKLGSLFEPTGAKGVVAEVAAELMRGRELGALQLPGKSAVVAVVNAALSVSPADHVGVHGYRTAPNPRVAYRAALEAAMGPPWRAHRRRALRSWLPCVLVVVAPLAALLLDWQLEPLGWQIMAGVAVWVAVLDAILWWAAMRQVRAAMWRVEALLCARGD